MNQNNNDSHQWQSEVQLCIKHNKNIEFLHMDVSVKGREKLLCELCLKEINGRKSIQNISELYLSIIQKKNDEIHQQNSFIQEYLKQINTHIDNVVQYQGCFFSFIQNVLDALNYWKQELENKIQDTSQYNLSQELFKFLDKNEIINNKEQMIEFLETKRFQYALKLKNTIRNLQDLAINNKTFGNLLEFIQQNQESKKMKSLQSIIKQNLESQVLFDRDKIEAQDEFRINEQLDDQLKIKFKINQENLQSRQSLALAFNYNDSIIATSSNKEINLWKFQDGKIGDVIDTLNGHTQTIYSIIFSKKNNWLFSAGKDLSIILWKSKRFIFNFNFITKQQYQNAHKASILQLLLNKNENQLISCSSDCNISIWAVNYKSNSIQYQYSLERHTGAVVTICLNQSNNLLVSSSLDKSIIIWNLNQNQEWIFKQVIDKTIGHFGYRISFISDTQIVWQSFKNGLICIFQEQNNIFQELPKQIQLVNNTEIDGDYSFPSIFNQQKQILIQKHHKRIYFCYLNSENTLTVQQESIQCNDEKIYGNLSNDGKYLAIWCNESLLIYEIDYKSFLNLSN